MRYRVPFPLAAVKLQARSRGFRRSSLTAASLRECSSNERLGPLCARTCSLSCGDSRGNCSIQVFRRCVPGRRLSGAEQNFSGRCSWKGKREKSSISLFLEIAAQHEERRDCQSQSPDVTPTHHNRGGSAHFSDNRHAVLSWASSTKPGGGKFPRVFLPVMYDRPPLFGLQGDIRGDSSIRAFRRCVPDRRLSDVEQNSSGRCS